MESEDIVVEPTFVLLFSIRLKGVFTGFEKSSANLLPIPSNEAKTYMNVLNEFEERLLGSAFQQSRRITRWPLGRITLNELGENAPTYADVYLLSHKSGVAVWEIWLSAPPRNFNAPNWITWLDSDSEASVVAQLWRVLSVVNQEISGKPLWSGLYFPLTLLNLPRLPLAELVQVHGQDIVRLLFRDSSTLAFKPDVVTQELARDYCLRQSGMTFLARRGGIDMREAEENSPQSSQPNPLSRQSFLPFLITVELLVLEHAVLQHLYDRLSRHVPKSVEELIALKDAVNDGLQEYSGVITNANRMTDAVTSDGEILLGLEDMYNAVMNKLEAVSFAITTQSQRHTTLMQFWLTIVFGATEIGFLGASLATWYYRTGLAVVLAWTIGATIVSGLTLMLVLRGKIE
jgi:hypothetical protein